MRVEWNPVPGVRSMQAVHPAQVSESRVMKGLGSYRSFPLGNRHRVAFVKDIADGEIQEAERLLCARKKGPASNLGQRGEDGLGKITLCPFSDLY